MTILVVITISNVACSCSHYNFDMPDNLTSPAGLSSFTSLVLSLTRSGYLLSKMTVMSGAVTEKIAPPPPSPPSSSWIDDLGFFSQVKLWTGSHNECCPRWQLQIFPAQWMTYDTDHPQARQLSTCSSVSPQSDTASSSFDIWNIGTIILIHLVYHMHTKFILKYSWYLYNID